MDYSRFYKIEDIINAVQFYYNFITKIDDTFFGKRKDLPIMPVDIEKTLSISRFYSRSSKLIFKIQYPLVNDPIKEVEFYSTKEKTLHEESLKMLCTLLYLHVKNLVNDLISYSLEIQIDLIEKEIQKSTPSEAIKMIVNERQKIKYDKKFPSKFNEKFNNYLGNRIEDFKEIIEVENRNFSPSLKEIVTSYKRGIEINVQNRELVEPLLRKDYDTFTKNLENLLQIPSYFDITEDDKERVFHVYLLGILEGRMMFYNVSSNKESGKGRYDICLTPISKINPGVIIELKKTDSREVNKEIHLEKGINQILDREYSIQLKNEGVENVLLISVLFNGINPYLQSKCL